MYQHSPQSAPRPPLSAERRDPPADNPRVADERVSQALRPGRIDREKIWREVSQNAAVREPRLGG
jgi:hypothetical protein